MPNVRTLQKTPVVIRIVVVVGLVALAAWSSSVGMPVAARARAITTAPLSPPEPANLAEARVRVKSAYGKLPLSFEENRGQADSSVRFISRSQGYLVFVTSTETILTLRQPSTTPRPVEQPGSRTMDADGARSTPPTVLTMKLVGSNPAAPSAGFEKLAGKVNYFIGNDPARWQKDLPTYAKVELRNVYPGVNMVHRGNQRQLEYDFVVAPGADPGVIRLSFSGMQQMHLDPGGDLVLTTAAGELRQQKPYIYQERAGVQQAVAGGYLLKGNNEIGFAVGAYDASLPLVLDPVLAYSTYLGGTLNDEARGIAVDADGNAYVAGVTSSLTTFPRVGGGPGVGGLDVFVSKLNAAGDALIYSTLLGDEQSESADGIAVDNLGHAYISGYTRSPGFPTTSSRYQSMTSIGSYAVFVTRLNADGNALVYSTFLGGSTPSTAGAAVLQEGLAIAVDSTGYAYITGWTNAANFPQLGAYQGSNRGQIDAFVTKLDTNASGSASLVYSTYLGGGTTDRGVGIAVDSAGRAYVTGRTDSGGAVPFPTTFNAIQGTLAGGVDAFVAKLDTTMSGGSSLVYSTYLGGSGNENLFSPWPGAIAVDSLGNAYVTGGTNSGTSSTIPFPTTANAYQATTFGLGEQDAFLTKLNPAGNALVYSTLFGGSGNDVGFGVAVDSAGHAYLAGETGQLSNADFPRRSPVQPTFGGGITDAFVAKLDTDASGDASLIYSTFLGGGHADLAFGIALDSTGNAYVTGKTNSAGIATAGAFQPSLGNPAGGAYSDAFVAKIEELPVIAPSGFRVSSIVGNLVTFRWTPPAIGPAPAGYVVEGGINPGQVLGSLPTGSAPIVTVAMVTGAFYVRVHAIDGAARSAASNEIRIFVNMPVPPSAPAGLVGLVNGSAVEIAWRNTFGGGAPSALILDVSGSLSASVPLGLSETARFPVVPAGNYTFSLRAANAAGISGPSNAVALSVPSACSGAPLPPENFLAYKIGNTAHVVWEPAATGPASTGYVLHVSGTLTLALPTNQRSLSGAVPPGTYNLSVSATNACGSSAATPVQTVVIP